MKLLLMEAHEPERLFLKSIFETVGFEVDDVQSWPSFAARIKAGGYEGVVVNLETPTTKDVDGVRFLETALDQAPSLPKFKVTAYTYVTTQYVMNETYDVFKKKHVAGSFYGKTDLLQPDPSGVYETLYDIVQDFGATPERALFSAEYHPGPSPVRGRAHGPSSAADKRSVFIIHGRNLACVDQLVEFLNSVDLSVNTWDGLTNTAPDGTPTIEENFLRGIQQSQAIIVVLTGDEDVRLRERFRIDGDAEAGVQSRPNVFYEAGIAIALRPQATIMLSFGEVRKFSDVAGRYIMKFKGSEADRQNLVSRLKNCGCSVKTEDPRFLRQGTFDCCFPEA